MQLPTLPAPQHIEAISPSLFEAMRLCKAKALWIRFGQKGMIPEVPNALLGSSYHKVMEMAAKGGLAAGDKSEAKRIFDAEADTLYARAHPVLRAKFPTKVHLPNYYLQRARAVLAGLGLVSSVGMKKAPERGAQPGTQPAFSGSAQTTPPAEQVYVSLDGKIRGKIDYIVDDKVIDYKAGPTPQSDESGISERERRQLTIYAYLALERGIPIRKGTIVRSNGQTATLDILRDEALAIAEQAKSTLADYNATVASGTSFNRMARPTKEACWFCPCIPFCEEFWANQRPDWSTLPGFGYHVEGVVGSISSSDLQGLQVFTMMLDNCRGLGPPKGGRCTFEQVPVSWVVIDSATLPQQGDVVRIVQARKLNPDREDLYRADKALSTIWEGVRFGS